MGPANTTAMGRGAPCRFCGRLTPHDNLGGFCKEKHRNEWSDRSVAILALTLAFAGVPLHSGLSHLPCQPSVRPLLPYLRSLWIRLPQLSPHTLSRTTKELPSITVSLSTPLSSSTALTSKPIPSPSPRVNTLQLLPRPSLACSRRSPTKLE